MFAGCFEATYQLHSKIFAKSGNALWGEGASRKVFYEIVEPWNCTPLFQCTFGIGSCQHLISFAPQLISNLSRSQSWLGIQPTIQFKKKKTNIG